ncbi:MAG TPA: fibronectin type III domain-containing protein [Candidatus Paceibacterota bacterium]|nr:fibronectin type III domain-containing protein [Candidatus Paceibacterota bacterium]
MKNISPVAAWLALGMVTLAGIANAQSASPLAPTSVTASLSAPSQITVSWSAPAATTTAIGGYYIYRNGAPVGNTSGLSFVDAVTAGSYTYTVAAYDANGDPLPQSLPTEPIAITADRTPPTEPTGLTVSSVTSSSVTLAWNASTDNVGVVGYYLTRNGARVYTATPVTGTSYTDTGLAAGSTYTYQVTAYDAAGNLSGNSNSVQAPTLPAWFTISTPYNLSATAISTSEIDLSWGAATDVSGTPIYYVYRNGQPAATTSATTYQDTGLRAGASYGYSVAAFDLAGNLSAQSQTAGASTLPAPLPPEPTSSAGAPATATATSSPGAPSSESTPPAAAPVFTSFLSFGSRGSQVQALQTLLIGQGDLGAGYATGYFGSLTQAAVQKFQCSQNVVCSGNPQTTGWGLVGAKTRKALNAVAG